MATRGQRTNREPFDLLGFTHYWGKTRKEGYAVKLKHKRMSETSSDQQEHRATQRQTETKERS